MKRVDSDACFKVSPGDCIIPEVEDWFQTTANTKPLDQADGDQHQSTGSQEVQSLHNPIGYFLG